MEAGFYAILPETVTANGLSDSDPVLLKILFWFAFPRKCDNAKQLKLAQGTISKSMI